jgi:PKD repeat protein
VKLRALSATVLLAALLAVALPTLAYANGRIVAARDTGAHSARVQRGRASDSAALPYGGGPVLHWNRTHLIFWQPSGSGLTFDPGYQALIEGFLRNVAVASHSSNSTYGLTGEYRDHDGPATYASIYGGAVTATDPLPGNGCTEPASTGPPGWNVCLTDQQLQREIERVVRRYRLPTTANDVYFLITPNGLGDCEDSSSFSCALGGAVSGYCGYHSQTSNGLVLYAVIPYNAIPGHCQSNNPRPNDNAADPAISTISHENIEMVTDPLGNAWINMATGNEMADLCLTNFGPNIGGSGDSAWNENVNGGHYYLQEVWSNHYRGCEPRAAADSASFQAVSRPAHPFSVLFSARGFDPQGRIVVYHWFFGGGRPSTGKHLIHRYSHPGHYRVTLRTTDNWGNWAVYAATVTVTHAGGRLSVTYAG